MTGDAIAPPLIEEYKRKAATGTPYDGSEPVRDLQQRRDLQPGL